MDVVRDIAITLASLSGALVAWLGLSTWRRQMRGSAEYELARRLLRSAYKVRDEVARFRNPMMSASELSTAAKEAGIKDPTNSVEVSDAAFAIRWNRLVSTHSEFEAEALEGEVLLGRAARTETQKLTARVKDLNFALSLHFMKDSNLDADTRKMIRSRLYQTSADPEKDELTSAVNRAIECIESLCRPLLKK